VSCQPCGRQGDLRFMVALRHGQLLPIGKNCLGLGHPGDMSSALASRTCRAAPPFRGHLSSYYGGAARSLARGRDADRPC
jgi:hypothetical protein